MNTLYIFITVCSGVNKYLDCFLFTNVLKVCLSFGYRVLFLLIFLFCFPFRKPSNLSGRIFYLADVKDIYEAYAAGCLLSDLTNVSFFPLLVYFEFEHFLLIMPPVGRYEAIV